VKLRRGTGYGDPLDAITPRKQQTIRSMTEEYLLEKSPDFHTLRFDAIGILVRGGGARITHVQDAF
jgi:putative endonuclease